MATSFLVLAVIVFSALQSSSVTARNPHPLCKLDDDYCDCGDEEFKTAACSLYNGSRLFQCEDKRFFTQSLYLSRIDDGVCDCCDGSDEKRLKHVKCPNKCNEIGRSFIAEAEAFASMRRSGLEAKSQLVMEAVSRLQEIRASADRLSPQIQQKEALLNEARERVKVEEAAEKEERVAIVKNTGEAFNTFFSGISEDDLRVLLAGLTILTKEDGVESILVECDDKFELEGEDPDDIAAFDLSKRDFAMDELTTANQAEQQQQQNAVEVGVDGGVTSEQKEKLQRADADEMVKLLSLNRVTKNSLMEISQHVFHRAAERSISVEKVMALLGVVNSADPAAAVPLSPVTAESAGHEREQARAARESVTALEQDLNDLREKIKTADGVKGVDFGPSDILFPLWDKCFNFHQKEYNYNICMFKEAKQDSTLLGRFSGVQVVPGTGNSYIEEHGDGIAVKRDGPPTKVYMSFTGGDICHATQRPHTFTLQLECHTEESVTEVEEPDICVYTAKLKTPLGCF